VIRLERKKKDAPPRKSPSCLRERAEKMSVRASGRGALDSDVGLEVMTAGWARAIGLCGTGYWSALICLVWELRVVENRGLRVVICEGVVDGGC